MFYKNNGRKKIVGSSIAMLCALFMLISILPQTALVEAVTMDVLYDGTMVLTEGETFEVDGYTVNRDTPLGALQAAADAEGFTYVLSDKKYEELGVLLLDDIGDYSYVKGGSQWSAFVNGAFKDGFDGSEYALNLIQLSAGDKVEFYYAGGVDKTDYDDVKAAAIAAVRVEVVDSSASDLDLLYDGSVSLKAGETFEVTAFSGENYTVDWNTPLGALETVAIAEGFTYVVGDKNFGNSGALLLDDIGNYPYTKNGSQWSAFVNGVFKDGFNNPDGALNLIQLAAGDKVEFYYVDVESVDKTDYDAVKAAATAAVKTVVDGDATGDDAPGDWKLKLSGAKDDTIDKAYFEKGMDCLSSHRASWTDDDGNTWEGMPLWVLVGMVDDNPDAGPAHYNFNDELAAKGYNIKVIAGDGWDTTLKSSDIVRDDGFIVANTLNGEPLPLETAAGKDCWPLHLKGSKIQSGQQVGNIVRIELVGLPEPSAGWELELLGKVGDTVTQAEFEKGLACGGSGHCVEWTDNEGNIWSGIPLRALVGAIDDIEEKAHWTFNDSVAAEGYTVKVIAEDGFSRTFDSADVAKGNDYIVANKINGELLSDEKSAPLRLVGAGVAKEDGSLSGFAVGNIVRIEIPELQTPPAAEGSWNLALKGRISYVFSQAEFEESVACHKKEWTDDEGNIWSGMPLRLLAGWVDDWQPHEYDKIQAMNGYKVIVKAGDGYGKDFDIKDIDGSSDSDYIIANKCNGEELIGKSWPLRLVGAGVSVNGALGGNSVGGIAEIELTEFGDIQPLPEVRIVKYAEDGATVLQEKTVDYMWMESELDVIGDGETIYRFEGITNNPDDVWAADGSYPGGFKIEDAIKGTRVRDLCELVGGMGTGTEIVFVAKDGWETRLPYSSIYTDPSVQERQGDAVLAWFANGKYVPDYRDGMRLFFTPENLVYSQWDMHETLPESYWHYYYGGGVQYPSCAGLSAKYITEIRLYSVPEGDWTFELDGRDIGGTYLEVSKTFFESALTCTFGANHKASYTDSKGRLWEGMPLWFLAGYVDDEDEHSSNAFNLELAQAGYDIVITADDGSVVTIESENIDRNTDYIIANTIDGLPIPESDKSWPLRLVGPAVSGSESISGIVSIELKNRSQGEEPLYTVTPVEDEIYTISETAEGISKMTVKENISGLKFFSVNIEPIVSHGGYETAVFVHLRNGVQLSISAIKADFDLAGIDLVQAGLNVKSGDVVKVYLVDELNNSVVHNPVILQ